MEKSAAPLLKEWFNQTQPGWCTIFGKDPLLGRKCCYEQGHFHRSLLGGSVRLSVLDEHPPSPPTDACRRPIRAFPHEGLSPASSGKTVTTILSDLSPTLHYQACLSCGPDALSMSYTHPLPGRGGRRQSRAPLLCRLPSHWGEHWLQMDPHSQTPDVLHTFSGH